MNICILSYDRFRSSMVRIGVIALLFFVSCSNAQTLSPEDRTVRILAIGNSFSVDALEEHLQELAVAAGHECEIGNLYIGGCSLERHAGNIINDAGAYEYRKIAFDGSRSSVNGCSVREALCDGEWDFVSVQQVSQLSGLYETYKATLPVLLDCIKQYSPNAMIVFHQTWAYAANSSHDGFANYDRNQQQMYDAIVSTGRRVVKEFDIDLLIPSGTAIQNMRGTYVGDNLTRDGYHLNMLGRYTAACVWFEAIFGDDVRENNYCAPGIDEDLQRMARRAANAAVENPYSVTALE